MFHNLLERTGLQPEQVVSIQRDHGLELVYTVLEMLEEFLFARSDGERLWDIINERYGLRGELLKALEVIGEKMGVTRERVRQLQNEALAKLRFPQSRKRLIDRLNDHIELWTRIPDLNQEIKPTKPLANPQLTPNFIIEARRKTLALTNPGYPRKNNA